MSLYSTGISGINTAQNMLETTAHNMANATTAGYHRQSTIVASAGGMSTGSGFIGRGVATTTISRDFDQLQFSQLLSSQTKQADLGTQVIQLSAVDSSFSDPTVGIAASLAGFFTSINNVATKPDDPAARQDLLGTGQGLATQIRAAYAGLQSQRVDTNTEISNAVTQANSLVDQVNTLNQQIILAKGTSGGQVPNDLLDARDQAVSDLSNLIGIKTATDGDGNVSITMTSGQALLSGTHQYPLAAVQSSADPQRTVVAYSLPAAGGGLQSIELADTDVSGGSIGALANFRANTLDVQQNRLGQLSVGLALQMNAVNKAGLQADGTAGGNYFTVPSISALSDSKNTTGTAITGTFVDGTALTASDYKISYDGTNYNVTRLSDNKNMGSTTGAAPLTVDGVQLTFTGTPVAGESWTLSPTRNAAQNFQQVVQKPNEIAAADSAGGTANGKNALNMAALQTKKYFDGGQSSMTEQFSQSVNMVAVQTAQAKSGLIAQTAIVKSQTAASPGGVNLDAEFNDLQQFQNFYIANSRVIDAASKMFDTVLGLTA
jgi:flagellar hook-associated protein 1 FlgK